MSEIRELPADYPSESALLGCVLLDGSCLPEIQSLVERDDFAKFAHQHIWEAAVAVQNADKAPDVVTVRSELQKSGKLEDAGGLAYLTSLVSGIPSSANFPAYASSVKRASDLRNLVIRLGS